MKRIYIIGIAAVIASLSPVASAQNLDPTVVVSRDYEARPVEVTKPEMLMAVPDSVLKFDMDVDYSVNPNPYKGSYEFRPYSLDIKPQSAQLRQRQFFLRAGAGYGLRPVVDFVYTPKFKSDRFSMDVYGTHRSYFGNFRSISAISPSADQGDEPVTLAWDKRTKERYSGYRTYTNAGVSGRYDWNRARLTFDVGYLGYAGKDTLINRGFDAVRANVRLASTSSAETYFYYDLDFSYLYGEDKMDCEEGPIYLTEHDFDAKISLGPVFSRHSRALVDVVVQVSDYGSQYSSYSGKFAITPRYIWDKDRWHFNIGAEVSILLGNDLTPYIVYDGIEPQMHTGRGQIIYPDVEIAFDAISNYLNIYLKAEGGDTPNRYSDLLRRNQFTNLYFGSGVMNMPLMDNTVERVKARLGFRGNISSRFVYDLNGGYARYSNLLLDAVTPVMYTPVSPGYEYSECNVYFVNLDAGWHSQDVKVDARLSYTGTDLMNRLAYGFVPSPFTADVDAVYNWRSRVFLGLHLEAALGRDGYARKFLASDHVSMRLPGYADLGISAEYKFNRKLSVWLYGGNLLNMTIQRSPLYATSGTYITGGITLSL